MTADLRRPGTDTGPDSTGAGLGWRWPETGRVVMVVTDRAQLPPRSDLVEVVAAALDGGAHAVLVRERDLPGEQRTALIRAVAPLCARSGAALLLSGPAPADVVVSGVHLSRHEPAPHLDRADVPARLLVGRSCHDLPELLRACDDRLDHVTISPVAATTSKPGYGPALGPQGLRELVTALHERHTPVPRVLALGGVDPTNAGRWVEAGADGVAVMGAVMRSPEPDETVRRVVRALDAAVPIPARKGLDR